jgi:hypothetical protein
MRTHHPPKNAKTPAVGRGGGSKQISEGSAENGQSKTKGEGKASCAREPRFDAYFDLPVPSTPIERALTRPFHPWHGGVFVPNKEGE